MVFMALLGNSLKLTVEKEQKKKKKRCEQNNAEDDSETFRGRIIQALRQLSIQSSPGWGQKKSQEGGMLLGN